MMAQAVRIFLLVCLLQEAVALVSVNSNMKSFSFAIKNGFLYPNVEKTLYEHNTGQPGVITEQWFTGLHAMDEDTRIRIYIDMELEASLDFQLFVAHCVGFRETDEIPNIPWGTRRLGHAANGGIYNTFRIPFGKSFRVTATRPTYGEFWYIIRGVENYPLVLGDLLLPPHTRLRLYKNEKVVVKPLDFLPLTFVRNSAGAVFLVTLVANSSNLLFLEGCMRAYIDGSNKTTWLSSGTEDFFLSAYYFDGGTYHQDNAGLTYLKTEPWSTLSAYKFFENDPVLFTKSLELWWRCSDFDFSHDKNGCPNTWPDPTPRRSGEFDTEDFFNKEKHSSQEEPSSKENFSSHKGFSDKEKFSSKDFIALKERISKEGKSFLSPRLQPAMVTTYTWVYEW